MTTLHQYGLNRSIIKHLRDKTDIDVDLVFDGYEIPDTRPLITIEQMQNNYESNTKLRESIEVIYRYQIGLRDENSAQLSLNQELLTRILLFDKFTFYNTLKTPFEPIGEFMCELTAVVPMFSDEITKKTDYNRVYFDVEIKDIKRRC